MSNLVNESLCGISHSNGVDYWVVVHGVSTSDFYSYLISSAGISSPVITSIGPLIYSNGGQLSADCSGSKIAYAGTSSLSLFDFDNSTGVLSNYTNLNFTASCCAFSPSGRYLYAGRQFPGGALNQYDIFSTNIAASVQLIANSSGITHGVYGAFGLGPDHKIYLSRRDYYYLSTINNPDLPGTACNYVDTSLVLTRQVKTGLPTFVNSFTGNCIPPAGYGQEYKIENEITVFPNPFSSNVMLTYKNHSPQSITIEVRNVLGEILWKKEDCQLKDLFPLDLGFLSRGIYILDINIGHQRVLKKIIKE
jgi:hypothetical protein